MCSIPRALLSVMMINEQQGKGQHIINCTVFTLGLPDIIKMREIYFSLISNNRSQKDSLPQQALLCLRWTAQSFSHSHQWFFRDWDLILPMLFSWKPHLDGNLPLSLSPHWRDMYPQHFCGSSQEKKKKLLSVLSARPCPLTLHSSFFHPSSAYPTCDNNDEHHLCKCN